MSARRDVGRYTICEEIASGGMAKVYLGKLRGPIGFARTVAIKGLHPGLTEDPQFVAMLLDEAHLASKVRHPNVVPIIDMVWTDDAFFLVLEYVHGMSLSRLLGDGEALPPAIAVGIATGVLSGLHAAHEATGEDGAPLAIVHRDISPQNIMVGVDGVPRVLDFGIAKASSRAQSTVHGQLKGKVRYMSPEQLRGQDVDRRADIFAASVVLWEMLTGRRLFEGDEPGAIVARVLLDSVKAPSGATGDDCTELDAVVLRGLAREPADRFLTARDMASALESAVTPATARAIGEWVERTGGAALLRATERLQRIELNAAPVSKTPEAPTKQSALPQVPDVATVQMSADAIDDLANVAADPPQRKRSRLPLGVAALAIVAAAVAVAYGARNEEAAPAAASPAPIEEPARSAAPPDIVAETAAPVAEAPAAPPKPEAIPPQNRAPVRRPLPRPEPKATPSASACDPPYTLVKGMKRFKPECI
jgi:serine/threonine-protein kinase